MQASTIIAGLVAVAVLAAIFIVFGSRIRKWAEERQINATKYIVVFTALVTIACSVMVSSAAVFLKNAQRRNELLDKQRNVLAVAGLVDPGERVTGTRARELFDQFIEVKFIDLEKDVALMAEEAGLDPATYDQQKAASQPATSIPVESNPAGVTRIPKYAMIYEVYKTPEKEELDLRVLPVRGLGLWGTLYGFLALDKDGRTIRGLTFYQHKETPGLGGEVDNPRWKAKWPGRKAYDEDWDPAIEVIKGSAGPPAEDPYHVDGLSGATITSKGVTNLLQFWLSDKGFGEYLAKVREEGSAA